MKCIGKVVDDSAPRVRIPLLLRLGLLAAALAVPGLAAESPIDQAFNHLYNFNFPAAHGVLDQYIAAHPQEALPYAVRASAYLFYELDRLGILESEFLTSDKRLAEKKKLQPDPAVRTRLFQAIDDAQSRANAVLASRPNDHDALFAMCITLGVNSDYMALVDKRQMRSLSVAKASNRYAQQLLKIDPKFYDAYLAPGINDYMLGSLPFFVRWFVHFDNLQGSKDKGIQALELVARSGHYLRPFAKILLGIVYLREKKPRKTEQLLAELNREYPGNPLIRQELAKIAARLSEGGQ